MPTLYLAAPSTANIGLPTQIDSCDIFTLWHKRLGHPSAFIVKNVLDKCNIVFNKECIDTICIACQKGKSHKLQISPSTGRNWYYVSFIGMCTHFTWIYLIRQKSQVVDCFVQLQQLIKTKFGKTIKQLQSDWGGEFRAFTSGYVFCCAVHLINRLPTSILKGQSPFKMLYGQDPTNDHLRVLECCCFPCLSPFLRHKLDFQSQPCTFLGYSSQHKRYHCLTPDGKIIISHHVVFYEHRFLFPLTAMGRSSSSSNSLSSTYIPLVKTVCSRPLETSSTQTPEILSSPRFCPSISVNSRDTMGSTFKLSFVPCLPDGDYHDSSPTIPSGSPNPPTIPTNTHPMVTRSKAGIFKPKAMTVEAVELHTIEEAFSTTEWRYAAQAEYDALMSNSTWELVPAPNHRKVISCKWLFKVKKNPDGTIACRKARLVTKGCSQVLGGWHLRQVDVNNVFLNGNLIDEVFMQQPPRYVQYDSNGKPLFLLSKSDASLFVKVTPSLTLYVLLVEVTRPATGCLHLCNTPYPRPSPESNKRRY
ncbi:hypothetical protein CXB51_001530 [Gossypium anomalum]|uniref:Reverse transcriptase Ty1/copia-type domain-containing protein n=1 Tax=Gossypium anomalum TaxID=47600 RepID=A0A8J6DF25_9ROSI|nr:hypothetical protein CXB51_001530 [Gossypium anomalum]